MRALIWAAASATVKPRQGGLARCEDLFADNERDRPETHIDVCRQSTGGATEMQAVKRARCSRQSMRGASPRGTPCMMAEMYA